MKESIKKKICERKNNMEELEILNVIKKSVVIFTLLVCSVLINVTCVFAMSEQPSVTPEVSSEPLATPQLLPTEQPTVSPCVTMEPTATPVITCKPYLNKEVVNLGVGQVYKMQLFHCNDDLTWKSANKAVASITKSGRVRALTTGSTKIYAKCDSKKYICKINVKDTGLDRSCYNMEKGESLKIHFTKNKKNIKWSTSDKSVVKVKNEALTAVSNGIAVISASIDDKLFECSINVKSKIKNIIYLTFDDGPSLSSTPKILNILKKNNVPATFFTIAYDKYGEKLIKRESEEGHTVAIHGSSHDYGRIYTSKDAYFKNITDQQKRIKKTLGYNVWITRFPGGSSNLVSRHYCQGIMRILVRAVNKAGFTYFDWNVSSGDAGGVKNSSQVYSNVVKTLRKNQSNVVLMHDFANNNKTIGALDSIIKYGKAHGYTFKAITNSTSEVHHNVQN